MSLITKVKFSREMAEVVNTDAFYDLPITEQQDFRDLASNAGSIKDLPEKWQKWLKNL